MRHEKFDENLSDAQANDTRGRRSSFAKGLLFALPLAVVLWLLLLSAV